MTLMEAWKDSLQLCKPQAMKLMFLVTLNAMRQAMRALFAVWFLVPALIVLVLSIFLGSIKLALADYSFVLISCFLAVRPSINIKDWHYFKRYFFLLLRFVAELLLWIMVIVAILALWELLFVPFGHVHSFSRFAAKSFAFTPINYIAIAPAYCANIVLKVAFAALFIYYAAFFYLDKVGSAYTACKKALLLICYNLPMIIMYTGIFWATKLLVQFISAYSFILLAPALPTWSAAVFAGFFSVLDFFFYLFSFALVSNIYTKRVHDQYYIYQ
jgi:hypothetical protein